MKPDIVAVMLTRGRPEMARRSVERFIQSEGVNARLLVYLNGPGEVTGYAQWTQTYPKVVFIGSPAESPLFELMNRATARAIELYGPDVAIAKWDDDDFYAPERLREQWHHLNGTGAMVTGYYDMPLWDGEQVFWYSQPTPRYAVGASLMYWADAWRQYNFPDTRKPAAPEGRRNPRGCGSDTAFVHHWAGRGLVDSTSCMVNGVPRLIARLHPGNTSMTGERRAFKLADEDKTWMVKQIMKGEQ